MFVKSEKTSMIFVMEKWNGYPDGLMVSVYALMGFCSAGAFRLSLKGMALITAACVIQGIVMVLNGKAGMHLYLRRLTGSFFAMLAMLILRKYMPVDDTLRQLTNSIILPVAGGTLIVEGLCHAHKPSGRKQLLDGVMVAFCLAAGAFLAIKAGGMFL